MRSPIAGFLVGTIFIGCFSLPPGLSAKSKRGADLVVTKLDGSHVSGELISVRPDSLLLVSGEVDLSVGIAEIASVRIVRRSRALPGGALVGAGIAGGLIAVAEQTTEEEAGALMAIPLGALVGMALGAGAGRDARFSVAGEPEAAVARNMDRLRAYSREAREPGTPLARGHRPRFRLTLAASDNVSRGRIFEGTGSFLLPEDEAPEPGPHPMSFHQEFDNGWAPLGPFNIAYELTAHWAAEIEVFAFRHVTSGASGTMTYTSGTDGLTFSGPLYLEYDARATCILAGLTYRPLATNAFRRYAIEFGAAVGPAFIESEAREFRDFSFPVFRKVALSGRLQATYDYAIFVPGLSERGLLLGSFIGYRFMESRFAELVGSGHGLFQEEGLPDPPGFERSVQVTLPDLPLDGSGIYFGFRIGIRL